MSDELFDGIMKTFLAQLDSSLKISKIISEHSGEGELSEDSIISGLVYRLMTPMENEEMTESFDNASGIYDKLLYGDSCSDSDNDNDSDGCSDNDDNEGEIVPKELTLRKVKTNNCNCEICIQARVCLINYKNHEPKDNLEMIYKNAIESACGKGKLYI
tara:strand:- start:1139 stop:1615 length:477 start_codon:yes stop_codon:yes gene_type:complete